MVNDVFWILREGYFNKNKKPKIKDKQIAITTYTQLGLLYLDQGQMELAHTALEEAVRQGKKHKDSYRLVKALIALADCRLMQRYDMKALEHYQEALKLTEKHSFDTLRFDILLEITEITKRNNLPTYQKYIDEFRQSALSLRDQREVKRKCGRNLT
jgi:tetratricopeptide (TPR) repeat protein